jgi:hypothetical protein
MSLTTSSVSKDKVTSFEVYVSKEDFKFHAAHFVGAFVVILELTNDQYLSCVPSLLINSCSFHQPLTDIGSACMDTTTKLEFAFWGLV